MPPGSPNTHERNDIEQRSHGGCWWLFCNRIQVPKRILPRDHSVVDRGKSLRSDSAIRAHAAFA